MMTYLLTGTRKRRRDKLFDWLRQGLDLLFPPRCAACSKLESWFCAACQATVELVPNPICFRCGRPVPSQESRASTDYLCSQCQINPISLDGVRSYAIHDGALRQAIHHLKYRGRRELAVTLGRMLVVYWQELDLRMDMVIPVPLHTSRQKERGFNQAGLLACVLADNIHVAYDETQLVRARATAPQVGLGAKERQSNVQDAFVWTADRLNGLHILLVDDVCTTGATLEACALALRQAGAVSIWALTLARAR